MNPAKSKYSPGPAPKNVTTKVESDETHIKIDSEGTDGAGKPTHVEFDAKFDGKDYEIKGDPGHTMVSVKRIDKRTIEETDKRNGKVEGVLRLTVSPDGKMIHAVYENKRQGTTTTWKMKKES